MTLGWEQTKHPAHPIIMSLALPPAAVVLVLMQRSRTRASKG
jgi:hypothetical protein